LLTLRDSSLRVKLPRSRRSSDSGLVLGVQLAKLVLSHSPVVVVLITPSALL
jgi:hypothetical protein